MKSESNKAPPPERGRTSEGQHPLVQLLNDMPSFEPADLDALQGWWLRSRRPDETLEGFLVRMEVLRPDAEATIAVAPPEYVWTRHLEDMAAPGGMVRLQRFLRSGEADTVVEPDASSTVLPAPEPPPAASRRPQVEAGSTLGKCLLLERLGEGATCVVFRAQHRTLDVPVAVKVFSPEALEQRPERFEALRAEAQLLARLNHPQIVRVLDFEDDPQQPFMVLEFVEGTSLAEMLLVEGTLTPQRAAQIISQACEGLDAAHKMGLVHRDVKPDNLLLPLQGKVKIADFGVAALDAPTRGRASANGGPGLSSINAWAFEGGSRSPGVMGDGSSSTLRNLPSDFGLGAGTPAYMAPEQSSDGDAVDHRADVYALGVTLFQCLTGRLPFRGKTVLEVLVKHCRETPPLAHAFNPAVPPALSNVVLRMMAKRPEDRYQTYGQVRRALTAALAPPRRGLGDWIGSWFKRRPR